MHFYKVASSSPKGRGKGAMVKCGCILPLKTRKVLENQGLLCQGAKLLPQYVFGDQNDNFKNEDLRSKSTALLHYYLLLHFWRFSNRIKH